MNSIFLCRVAAVLAEKVMFDKKYENNVIGNELFYAGFIKCIP